MLLCVGLKWHPDWSRCKWDTHHWHACLSGKDVSWLGQLQGNPWVTRHLSHLAGAMRFLVRAASSPMEAAWGLSPKGDTVLESLPHVLPLSMSLARHAPAHSTGSFSIGMAMWNSTLKTLYRPWLHWHQSATYSVRDATMGLSYLDVSTSLSPQ